MVLINAVKDVAKALGDLIGATKAAAGKAGDDPAVYQLKNSAKVCTGAQRGEGNGAGGLENEQEGASVPVWGREDNWEAVRARGHRGGIGGRSK